MTQEVKTAVQDFILMQQALLFSIVLPDECSSNFKAEHHPKVQAHLESWHEIQKAIENL